MAVENGLGLTGRISNACEGDTGSYNELRNTNPLRGAGIILMFAWLQGQYDENKWQNLIHPPNTWQQADEWRNLYLIRHCFAHSLNGDLLDRHRQSIIDFHQRLANGDITDLKGRTEEEYYRIENDRVILENRAVRKSRSLCIQFLQQFPP